MFNMRNDYPPEWDEPEVPEWAWQAAEKELGAEFDRLALDEDWLALFAVDHDKEDAPATKLRQIYIEENLDDCVNGFFEEDE